MKKLFKNILLFSSVVALFASCEKDENRITYEGATAPVLTPSSTADLVLSKTTATQHAISFAWTNPDYKFTTGISSQDVTYYLEFDTTGAGFTTPGNLSAILITNNLHIDLTDSVLNYALGHVFGDSGLAVDQAHSVEMRIKSTLRGSTVPLYSNVVTVMITPYLDAAVPPPPVYPPNTVGELYLTGSGSTSGWDNAPPLLQKFTRVSEVEYFIIVDLQPGLQIKFLAHHGFWQPQYGLQPGTAGSDSGGSMGFNMGLPGQSDPTEIPTPTIPGTYKITALFIPGKYKFELQ
jgi:hypothetical protein